MRSIIQSIQQASLNANELAKKTNFQESNYAELNDGSKIVWDPDNPHDTAIHFMNGDS